MTLVVSDETPQVRGLTRIKSSPRGVVKNKGGRPKGTKTGQQLIVRIRNEFEKSLKVLHDKNMPLHLLMAEMLEKDTAGALNALAKFLPREVNVEHQVTFVQVLEDVKRAVEARGKLVEGNTQEAKIFDVVPIEDDE